MIRTEANGTHDIQAFAELAPARRRMVVSRIAASVGLAGLLLAVGFNGAAATVEEVRAWAGARDVERLLLAVADADAVVAQDAAQSLDEMNEPLGGLVYAAIWRGTPEARAALAERKDFRATAPLVEALHMPLPAYQRYAALALGDLGDKSAVPALIEVIGRQETSLRVWSDRSAFYWALYKLADPRALDVLLAGMGSIDPRVRVAAAWGVANVMEARAVSAMLAASDDPSPGVRAAVAHAFRRMPSPEAAPILILLLTDPDPGVREKAAYALAEAADEAALVPLRTALGDRASAVREAAVWALGRHKDEASVAQLFGLLGDPEAKVRAAAASVLQGMGQPVGVQLLAAMNGDSAAMASLASSPDPRIVPPLIALMAGEDAATRNAALRVLATSSDEQARAALVEAASKWEPVERSIATWALITAPSISVVGKTRQLARVVARPSSLVYLTALVALAALVINVVRRRRSKR